VNKLVRHREEDYKLLLVGERVKLISSSNLYIQDRYPTSPSVRDNIARFPNRVGSGEVVRRI
jgi:hypothetical protein